MKFESSTKVGILPLLLHFGDEQKLIFKLVSEENRIGFKAWNGRFEAMALSPLLGTNLETLAKKFLKDIYWIVSDNELILFGNIYGIKDELKQFDFKWGGYEPTPNWKVKFSDFTARLINEKYGLDIPTKEVAIEKKDYSDIKVWQPPARKLWDHQIDGVKFVLNQDVGALIAWEMGTGKTSLAFSVAQTIKKKLLMVVRAFLRFNVYDEAIKNGLKPAILPQPKSKNIFVKDEYGNRIKISNPYRQYTHEEADVIICSYAFVGGKIKKREIAEKIVNNFGVLVFDESTAIKSRSAQRTKGSQLLCEVAKNNGTKLIFMTGTPTMNQPAEIWTTLKILNPYTENWWDFTRKYNGARKTFWGWEMGNPNPESLLNLHAQLTSTIMSRVLKDDCLDLPIKIRTDLQLHGVSVNIPAEPEEFEKGILGWLMKYKSAIAKAKVRETVELAQDSTPCLIFTEYVMEGTHPAIVKGLQDKNLRVGAIHGGVSEFDRRQQSNLFEEGKLDVLVIQIATGGMGLNLPRAKNVIFNDLPWNPGNILQAEDRAHRYDDSDRSEEEKKLPITVTLMVSDDELDQKIFGLSKSKFSNMSALHDGKVGDSFSEGSIYKEVRNYFLRKHRGKTLL